MNQSARLLADPILVYALAAIAIALLLITVWLFRRRRRSGRQAAVICLLLSIGLHVALLVLVPLISENGGGVEADPEADDEVGVDAIAFSTFDPEMDIADESADDVQSASEPLPVADLQDLLAAEPETQPTPPAGEPADQADPPPPAAPLSGTIPESLSVSPPAVAEDVLSEFDWAVDDFLDPVIEAADAEHDIAQLPEDAIPTEIAQSLDAVQPVAQPSAANVSTPEPPVAAEKAPPATVAGSLINDFANRNGSAKQQALLRTGGDAQTEAAVSEALRYLVSLQRADGAWDPQTSGGGKDFAPLGETRGGAGARAETALTGLALLSLMGAGHTHREGDYSHNVYRGLAYLIGRQKPDGSLAGDASVYAANYSHGMAALALGEAAAMTGDGSAIEASTRALAYTRRMQHPSTGGFRYTAGDPGDLSQLGWQAMVMDAAHRAGIPVDGAAISGVQRFLRSVRSGRAGGLACYRPGEAPSRTMTAEALATRLLFGESVPAAEIAEAETYLLRQPPGVGQDNYYYWYYATLALHQLQDEAWSQWNAALKRRLLSTQRSDGSWSADTVWGGYGGSVYSTSMAALCLEAYYRHALRRDHQRIAGRPDSPPR